MKRTMLLASVLLLVGMACSTGYHIPEGDVSAGRAVFETMQCYTCHRVAGESFPEPVADPPVPFVLGTGPRKSRQYLAESVLAPSHRFARPPVEILFSEPPAVQSREYKDVREGDLSRMGDFSEDLTLRQWIDLTAYLESIQQ